MPKKCCQADRAVPNFFLFFFFLSVYSQLFHYMRSYIEKIVYQFSQSSIFHRILYSFMVNIEVQPVTTL